MPLRTLVGRFVTPATETRLRECRDCGTDVGCEADVCPACGSTAIAEYELDG